MSEQRRQAVIQSSICECSQAGCAKQVDVPLAVYANLEKAPGSFLVVAGHENLEREIVMGGHGSYRIVWTKLSN